MPDADFPSCLSDIDLSKDAASRLEKFLQHLKIANQKINLISYADDRELFINHLRDSLMVLLDGAARDRNKARVIDVGSGGGFPGVPLAIARPGWSVTLLDSIQKKGRALKEILQKLGLSASILSGRAEELGRTPEHRESYDIALCRAVGGLSTVLEITLPFLRVGGVALLHRGTQAEAEVEANRDTIGLLGGAMSALSRYRLPGLRHERLILHVDKTHQTDIRFPRRSGVPTKRPLCRWGEK